MEDATSVGSHTPYEHRSGSRRGGPISSQFETTLSRISNRLMRADPGESPRAIHRSIAELGAYMDASRAALVEFSDDKRFLTVTHEWTRAGVETSSAEFQNVPVSVFPHVAKFILAGEIFRLCAETPLPDDAHEEQATAARFGVRAHVSIPMIIEGNIIGALSIDSQEHREWPEWLLVRLRLVAEIFASALERNRRTRDLSMANQRYRSLMAHVTDIIIGADADGRMEYVSDSAETVSGVPADEWIGRSLHEVVEEGDLEKSHREFGNLLRDGKVGPLSFRVRNSLDGSQRSLESTATAFDDIDGKTHIAIVSRDVTAQRQSEAALKSALAEIAKLRDQLEEDNTYLREEIRAGGNFTEILGESPPIRQMIERIGQVADTEATALVLGETGTGKELAARAIHERSRRRGRPMVKVNCATLPEHLIESALFGHTRGAFTGAVAEVKGRFELADGTTLFLDEIGELPLELQAKLLRVLQDGEFDPIGSSKTRKVDVRVIAATNRDLARCVAEGTFRADLYYRLNVFPVSVPPLRDRGEDVLLLSEAFVKSYGRRMGRGILTIPPSVESALQAYQWPGNVRELENVIQQGILLSTDGRLALPDGLVEAAEGREPAGGRTLRDVEHAHLLRTLNQVDWRIEGPGGAAEVLDVKPATLRSKLRRHGIERPTP